MPCATPFEGDTISPIAKATLPCRVWDSISLGAKGGGIVKGGVMGLVQTMKGLSCQTSHHGYVPAGTGSRLVFGVPVNAKPTQNAKHGMTDKDQTQVPVATTAPGSANARLFLGKTDAASDAAGLPALSITSPRTEATRPSFGTARTGNPCAPIVIQAPSNVRNGAQARRI